MSLLNGVFIGGSRLTLSELLKPSWLDEEWIVFEWLSLLEALFAIFKGLVEGTFHVVAICQPQVMANVENRILVYNTVVSADDATESRESGSETFTFLKRSLIYGLANKSAHFRSERRRSGKSP